MDDRLRAAIIAFIQSTFPVLVLLGIVQLTEVQVAGIILVLSNALTVFMLVFKKGQQLG